MSDGNELQRSDAATGNERRPSVVSPLASIWLELWGYRDGSRRLNMGRGLGPPTRKGLERGLGPLRRKKRSFRL